MSRTLHAGRRALVASALAGLSLLAAAAVPSTRLALTGAVERPATYDLAGLKTLPASTQTVTFQSGSGTQTHTYTGTSLWGLLDRAGVRTDPTIKNDLLNRIVVTTGTDGYRSVYALGELSPNFGNRQSLVAYAEQVNGTTQPLGADGFARVTAPGDVKGGRYVSNLASIDVQRTASRATGSGGGPSTRFSVGGDVRKPMSFDLAALKALPAIEVTAGSTRYTGVSFWDLLNTTVGLRTDVSVKNDVLGIYVVATGSDGYKAAFSLGELNPAFGNQPDLIAYAADGEPLGDNGFARLVIPNDVKGGRYVSNLVSLEVFHAAAVPEPRTHALMAVGLVGLALLRRAAPAI